MVNEIVGAELRRYGEKETVKGFIKGLKHIGFRFIFLKRKCEATSKLSLLGFLYRLAYSRMQIKYGFQIPHVCKIGKGLFLGHFGNIVINQHAVIGENCNIAQGVTIGHVSRGKKKGNPIIGDRVWIGANSVVVGNILIGNDVLIAPLSFVNFDVPANAVIAGNPAKIVSMEGSNGYLKNLV